MSIDGLSTTAIQLKLYTITNYNCSTATGFFYQYENNLFLITNRHVFTGVNNETGENLDEINGARPSIVNFKYKGFNQKNNNTLNAKVDFSYPLYNKEDKPNWFVHPIFKDKVDVVALPIVNLSKNEIKICTIQNMTTKDESDIFVSQDVFVLGYPKGISQSAERPIWKRASIATEPSENYYKDIPTLLIDTATRQGMSGSPVFVNNKFFSPIGDSLTFEKTQFLLGVYSGRLGKNEMESQLGIVWKRELIEEIIKGNILDNIL